MEMIKAAGSSRTAVVAGAIACIVRQKQRVDVQTIGAAAVNQAVKALILAISYLREDDIQWPLCPMMQTLSSKTICELR